MKFKNMKFVVRDREHSRQIQEAPLAAGYKWFSGNNIQYPSSSYLYVNNFGMIQHGNDQNFFEKDKCKLSILLDITNPIKSDFVAQPTITIGGNLYLVSDVENALKNLTKIRG